MTLPFPFRPSFLVPGVGSGSMVTINNPSTTLANQGNTYVDLTTAVLNSVTVSKIGMYSTTARTVTLKIVKRNSANNYDVVVNQSFSHTGSGWENFPLSSEYTVPGSGSYYLASYVAAGGSNPNVTGTVSRAYLTGSSMTGNGQSTTAEDASGAVHPLRYVHSVTYAQISQELGSIIGDMTANGGLAAAFDGVTSQIGTSSALRSSTSNAYCGKNYSSTPQKIGKALIYGSSDTGYLGSGISSGTAYLYAKASSPASYNDGTLLGQVTIASDADATDMKTIISGDQNTSWNYVWIALVGNTSGALFLAEVQIFSSNGVP